MAFRAIYNRVRVDPANVPEIRLSGSSVIEGTVEDAIIGRVEVYVRGVPSLDTWALSLELIAPTLANQLKLVGGNLKCGSVPTDFEDETQLPFRIRAVNSSSGKAISLLGAVTVLDLSVAIIDIDVAWQAGFTAGACLDSVTGSLDSPTPVAILTADPDTIDGSWELPDDGGGRLRITKQADLTGLVELIAALPAGSSTLGFRARLSHPEAAFSENFSLTITADIQAPTGATATWHTGFAGGVVSEYTEVGTTVLDSFTVVGPVGRTYTPSLVNDPDLKAKLVAGAIVLAGTLHYGSKTSHAFTMRFTDDGDSNLFVDVPFTIVVGDEAADATIDQLLARFDVPLTTARRANSRRLIARIVRTGFWAETDLLFNATLQTQQQSNENWVQDVGVITPRNSCPWVANQGYTGDGVNKDFTLGIDPLALGTLKMTTSSIFGLVVCLSDSVNLGKDFGSGNGRLRLVAKSAGKITGAAGQNTVSTQDNVGGVPPSIVMVTQRSGEQKLWRNGATVPGDIDTVTPALLPSALTGLSTGGGEYSDRTVAMLMAGRLTNIYASYFEERWRSLCEAINEYLTAIPLEIPDDVEEPLPDVDVSTTLTGITYARAGQFPYINSSRQFALAAADTWPLDHDVETGAVLGRRLPPSWALTNRGSGRVFTGWSVGGSGVTFGANTGYTTFFGDTLGGTFVEGTGAASTRTATGPLTASPHMPANRGSAWQLIVKPVAMVDRNLRVTVKSVAGSNSFSADFLLTGSGSVARTSVVGLGKIIHASIKPMLNGFYLLNVKGACVSALNSTSGGTQQRLTLQFVTAAGSVSVPGASNSVHVDAIAGVPQCSTPLLFGTLTSVSAPSSLKLDTTADDTYDVVISNEASEDWVQRDVVASGGTGPDVSWPMYAHTSHRQSLTPLNNFADFHTSRYSEQWIKRIRALRAPDGEALVNPALYAQLGEIYESVIVPNVSPFTVTLAQAPGGVETVEIAGLTRVTGTPATGQFKVVGSVITFHINQGGSSRRVHYWNAYGYMPEMSDRITGGGSATWEDVTATTGANSLGGKLTAAFTTTPRRVRLASSVSGEYPYQAAVRVKHENMTIRGNSKTFLWRGGNFWLGDLGGSGNVPKNLILEDMILTAGVDPIAQPLHYQQAFAGTVQMTLSGIAGAFILGGWLHGYPRNANGDGPEGQIVAVLGNTLTLYGYRPLGYANNPPYLDFVAGQAIEFSAVRRGTVSATATVATFTPGVSPFGTAMPAEGWGAQGDVRECCSVTEGTDIIWRHFIAKFGVDEMMSNYVQGLSGNVINILYEYGICAQPLIFPKDPQGRGFHNEEQAHGECQLLGVNGSSLSGRRSRNVTVRHMLYACSSARNPMMSGTEGAHIYNCFNWNHGNAFGMGLQTHRLNAIPATVSCHDNIVCLGPDTPTDKLEAGGNAALKIFQSPKIAADNVFQHFPTAAYHVERNWKTNLTDHNADTLMEAAFDPGNGMFLSQHDPRVLSRNRPFFSAELAAHPEKCLPTITALERATLVQHWKDRCGPRPRDGSDNIIPGSFTNCYPTEYLIGAIFGKTLRHINNPEEDAKAYAIAA